MGLILFLFAMICIAFMLLSKHRSNRNNGSPVDITKVNHKAKINDADDERSDYNDNYWFPVESIQRQVSTNLRLRYTNTSNETSERDFDVIWFSRGEKGFHIHGYCHKKKRKITLSSVGINNVIDLETGEAVSDVHQYLEVAYKKSKGYLQDLLFEDYGWAIYPLVYLAASSGSIVKKERDIISKFIKSLPNVALLDSEWIDLQLKNLYRPGKMEIRSWVKEDISRGKDFSLIEEAIAELKPLQKEENKEFHTFYNYIQKQAADRDNSNA